MSDGVPHNAVSSVLQTRDGYLWIGTAQGLARFDGVRFKVFNAQNTPAIKGQRILFLHETKDGVVWFATENGGLTCFKDGAFSFSPLLQDQSVWSFCEGDDGSLW